MSPNPSFADAKAFSDPLVGELIEDRYRIQAVLGSGGTGTVYLAEHVMMEKRVALKVLHPTHAVIGSAMERFQREAIALGRIEHPNVVNATDFGKLKNGAYYLALEYVEGSDLGDVLAEQGAFDLHRALRIGSQIASALVAAHSQGIVHRDLKPHNVMLTRGGDHELAKVLDFGLAKLRSKSTEASINISAGQVFGTPHYMAPEQISGENVDHRADLYALGVLLYEMISGRRPFDSKDVREVLSQQVTSEAAPLPDSVPLEFRRLVEELMKKNKEERPSSAAEVLARLESLMPKPSEPVAWAGWLQRPVTVARWSLPMWAMILPAAAFLILFAGGLVLTRPSRATTPPTATVALPAPIPEPAPAPHSTAPKPDRWPALIADAEFGREEAVAELLKIPEEERSEEVWVVLIHGRVKQEAIASAMDLLRKAAHHKPALSDNEALSKLVRVSAANPEAFKEALGAAATTLGSRGVDVLFSVWADTKRRTPATALAEQYLQQEEVLERASPAVKLALKLRDENDCESMRSLLSETKEYGDSRSVRPLLKLRKTTGCGKAKQEDCYPCLRKDDLLQDALKAASSRRGPKY